VTEYSNWARGNLVGFLPRRSPCDYELAKNADITVLMWRHHQVKVNHAYKGELTNENIQEIVADIPKVLRD
jgi:hypothetical protein